jgi:low temperature requirement protein LtrA
LTRGLRFCRQRRDVYLVDSSCFLLGPTLSFFRCLGVIVPNFVPNSIVARIGCQVNTGRPVATISRRSRTGEPHPQRHSFSYFDVIAVMHGMESQEFWTAPAAASAFTGMAITFMLWWWYFDGASGASERHVTSHRDAVRFQIWTYGHLPLCLGIALTGIGLQHVVHLADAAALPATDVSILAMSMAGTMAARIVIGSTVRRVRPSGGLIIQVFLSAAPFSLTYVAGGNVPVVVVLLLAALCAMQLLAATERLDTLTRRRQLLPLPR